MKSLIIYIMFVLIILGVVERHFNKRDINSLIKVTELLTRSAELSSKIDVEQIKMLIKLNRE